LDVEFALGYANTAVAIQRAAAAEAAQKVKHKETGGNKTPLMQ
jgi:hypothetical protein